MTYPVVLADPNGRVKEVSLIENTGTYLYEGYASYGTGTDEPKWFILRTTLSGSNITAVGRADGDDKYNNVWDDRASLNYS